MAGPSSGKSRAEVYLMPLVVVVATTIGSCLLAEAQRNAATEQAHAERQVKILEIFAQNITSADDKQRELALRVLGSVDSQLAASLASAVADLEPEGSAIGILAREVASEAANPELPRVRIYVSSEAAVPRAEPVRQRLVESGFEVPRVRISTPITGGSQLRYHRPEDEEEAEEICGLLVTLGIDARPIYLSGSGSRVYELWLSATIENPSAPRSPSP